MEGLGLKVENIGVSAVEDKGLRVGRRLESRSLLERRKIES